MNSFKTQQPTAQNEVSVGEVVGVVVDVSDAEGTKRRACIKLEGVEMSE